MSTTFEPENDFEKDFLKVFEEIHPQIQEKITQAAALIREACELSDKHGIPFRPKDGTPFRMSYMPRSVKEKFPNPDWDFIADVTGAYGDTKYGGWQSSQTC